MFNMLSIPIYGRTLYDSLHKYFDKEKLESKYLDETNNKYVEAYRQIKIMRVPKYLIIILKRYKNNSNGSILKTNGLITFPIDKSRFIFIVLHINITKIIKVTVNLPYL